MKSTQPNFFDRHVRTWLLGAVMIFGWGMQYAFFQSRLSAVENRIEKIEVNVVPKSEVALKEANLDRRLTAMESSLARVEDTVLQIKLQLTAQTAAEAAQKK